jgi:hypothetical protein
MSDGVGSGPSYVSAAFNARPFGMPLPPNWFGLAAFGLLGAFVNPGFWLIGAGLEVAYLWWLSRNSRFRAAVDAERHAGGDWAVRYQALRARLDAGAAREQEHIESQAAEIGALLRRVGALETQLTGVTQMVSVHLRLLVARCAFVEVRDAAARERRGLEQQEHDIDAKLSDGKVDEELRRSLEQRRELINTRRTAHRDAERRYEVVNAEIERVRQQMALVREQALLATDEGSIARSLDALTATLNESNRWLSDQSELFSGFEEFTEKPPPADLLVTRTAPQRRHKERGETE